MAPIELAKEARLDLLDKIKGFFSNELEQEISDFKASIFLEFVLESIGPQIYNQAISDAYALMSERIEDLYGLEKRRG